MADFFFGDNEQAQKKDNQAQIPPSEERTEPWRVDLEPEAEGDRKSVV